MQLVPMRALSGPEFAVTFDTQLTAACFGQPCGYLKGYKIQRVVTLKVQDGPVTVS